ncbi:hypothetical protein [Dyadobacter sp. 3J3]|uniref:hypothetical protein n=1 Tax=Dyadobacter sp. 3J3 TaxID=2606600 RepID=UPI00135B7BD0|nr:hypothetical protein [Dyadobacter sp. 3J3]
MKFKFTLPTAFFLIFIFAGCSTHLRPLGYVAVQPYAKPFQKKVTQPLNIVLMEDVRDSLVMDGGGIKKMKVSDFRLSVIDGLKSTFSKNFQTINFLGITPEKGLVLVIYRIRPFWKVGGSSTSAVLAGNVAVPVTSNNSSAAFQFESSLFLNNKKIQVADSQTYSDELTGSATPHKIFEDGLRITCETINKMIFTDEVLEKIN